MAPKAEFFVYILASLSGTLYVGLTDDLIHRVWQHKNGTYDGFTKKYKVNRLMYYEVLNDARPHVHVRFKSRRSAARKR